MMEFEKASRYVKILHELYHVRSLILEDLGEDANETALINELIKNVHLHLNGIEVYQPVSDFQLALDSQTTEDGGSTDDHDDSFEGAVFGQALQFDLSQQPSPETEEEPTPEAENQEVKQEDSSEDDNSFNAAIEKQKLSNEAPSKAETIATDEPEEDEDAYDWDVADEDEQELPDDVEDASAPEEEEEEEASVEEPEPPAVEEEKEAAPKPKIKGIRILGRKQPGESEQAAAPEPEPEPEIIPEEPEPETTELNQEAEETIEVAQSHVEQETETTPEEEEPTNLFSFDEAQAEPEEDTATGGFNPEYEELFDQGTANEISDRLSSSVVSDLRKAFGLNERIFYTNELFGKDKNAFESALDVLNSLDEFDEARSYIEQKLIAEFNWIEARKRSKAKSFIRTVRRKFD